MKGKLVYYYPIAIFIFGLIWSMQTVSNRPAGEYVGMALGFVLLPAIPSALIALVHFLIVRNKNKVAEDSELGLIDSDAPAIAKRDFWFYFSNYLSVIGLVFCAFIVLRNYGAF